MERYVVSLILQRDFPLGRLLPLVYFDDDGDGGGELFTVLVDSKLWMCTGCTSIITMVMVGVAVDDFFPQQNFSSPKPHHTC